MLSTNIHTVIWSLVKRFQWLWKKVRMFHATLILLSKKMGILKSVDPKKHSFLYKKEESCFVVLLFLSLCRCCECDLLRHNITVFYVFAITNKTADQNRKQLYFFSFPKNVKTSQDILKQEFTFCISLKILFLN